ncbi:MAG: hypothetical protein J2P31_08965 [Blastocatellia bacterium]|nr:hypothetical protein [Blastocatellia bacterium]
MTMDTSRKRTHPRSELRHRKLGRARLVPTGRAESRRQVVATIEERLSSPTARRFSSKRPAAAAPRVLGRHHLPTLRGWWEGRDITLKQRLSLPSEAAR